MVTGCAHIYCAAQSQSRLSLRISEVMSLSVQQKQQHRWLRLKRFMTNVTKDSLSPTSWLLQQVDILHCHRLSKALLISNSLIRQMWQEKVGFHKPALVKHTAERWWNAMWWGWHERLQRHQWRSHQLSEHFYTPLGCGSCTWINTHTQRHTHRQIHSYRVDRKQTTGKLINTHPSPPFSTIFSLVILPFLSLSLSRFHIQTHSHSGGVIECDSKSWEGCWRVIRLTCEMEPTWHQQVGSDTYSRHGWITPAKTGG